MYAKAILLTNIYGSQISLDLIIKKHSCITINIIYQLIVEGIVIVNDALSCKNPFIIPLLQRSPKKERDEQITEVHDIGSNQVQILFFNGRSLKTGSLFTLYPALSPALPFRPFKIKAAPYPPIALSTIAGCD